MNETTSIEISNHQVEMLVKKDKPVIFIELLSSQSFDEVSKFCMSYGYDSFRS